MSKKYRITRWLASDEHVKTTHGNLKPEEWLLSEQRRLKAKWKQSEIVTDKRGRIALEIQAGKQ